MGTPEPLRTCVACRRVRPKPELIRVARTKGGEPRIAARGPGRGAYVCPEADCIRLAVRGGGVARALGTGLGDEQVGRLVTMAKGNA